MQCSWMIRTFLCGTIVLIAACTGDAGSAGGAGNAVGASLPVTVFPVEQAPLPVTITAVGQTEGSREVEIRSRVSGIIARQSYEEGSAVDAGAVLFVIEQEPYEIALSRAAAVLTQEQARNEQARRDVGRLASLRERKIISDKEAEDVQTTLRASDAAVLAAEANVREARLNLSYTRVTAPIAGITGRAQKSEGSLVIAGTESSLLTTLVQTHPVWVRFSLSEAEHDQVRRAMQGQSEGSVEVVLVSDHSGEELRGQLNFAGTTVDTRLGTVELRATFPNPDLRLLSGQHVQVRVEAGVQPAILVPRTAVLDGEGGKFVWVVAEDGTASRRAVEAGTWSGDGWVIHGGLATGDVVIIDNLLKLRPGIAVEAQPAAQGGAGTARRLNPGTSRAG